METFRPLDIKIHESNIVTLSFIIIFVKFMIYILIICTIIILLHKYGIIKSRIYLD